MDKREREYKDLQNQLVFVRSAYRRGELSRMAYEANRRIILGDLMTHRQFYRDAAKHALDLIRTRKRKRKRGPDQDPGECCPRLT